MPSLTVENYLKAALQISIANDSKWVATGKLAEALNVSPGTVTSMLKTLADAKLAVYKPYEGMRLTESGRRLALRMLRRHRLIELFLLRTLNITWDKVHEEAEHMEHAMSDYLIDRIDEHLGRPAFDPHGDPIPTADGQMRGDVDSAVPLSDCKPGTRIRVVRVIDQESQFLRYLSKSGLEIGAEGVVRANSREARIVTADVENESISMGYPAAEQILVERLKQ